MFPRVQMLSKCSKRYTTCSNAFHVTHNPTWVIPSAVDRSPRRSRGTRTCPKRWPPSAASAPSAPARTSEPFSSSPVIKAKDLLLFPKFGSQLFYVYCSMFYRQIFEWAANLWAYITSRSRGSKLLWRAIFPSIFGRKIPSWKKRHGQNFNM